MPALAKFQQTHPDLEVELLLGGHRVNLIDEHIDIAIQVGARKDINVVNLVLTPTRFHVVASPNYIAKHGAPSKPQDLKQHNCLLFVDAGQTRPWRFKSSRGALNVSVNSTWRSNSGHALRSAAEHSLGLAYLPDYYLGEDLASGKLVTVLDDWQAIDRDVVAIYQHKNHLSAKVRLVTQFLATNFQLQPV